MFWNQQTKGSNGAWSCYGLCKEGSQRKKQRDTFWASTMSYILSWNVITWVGAQGKLHSSVGLVPFILSYFLTKRWKKIIKMIMIGSSPLQNEITALTQNRMNVSSSLTVYHDWHIKDCFLFAATGIELRAFSMLCKQWATVFLPSPRKELPISCWTPQRNPPFTQAQIFGLTFPAPSDVL